MGNQLFMSREGTAVKSFRECLNEDKLATWAEMTALAVSAAIVKLSPFLGTRKASLSEGETARKGNARVKLRVAGREWRPREFDESQNSDRESFQRRDINNGIDRSTAYEASYEIIAALRVINATSTAANPPRKCECRRRGLII